LTQESEVLNFISKNNGQITNHDAVQLGISRMVLKRMVDKGLIIRLSPGIYSDPLDFGDDLAAIQYRFSKGVFCKSTALFLYDMIDRTPSVYEMNFPLNYAYPKKIDVPLKRYRQSIHLFTMGIETIKTPGGHTVRIYSIERTLCDILQKRNREDAETIKQAMNSYKNMRNKDIHKLIEFSRTFGVEDEIRKYMEVLL